MLSYSEQALSIPFRILPNGLIDTTTDQNKIWEDRVLSILGTGVGERVRQPPIGSEIYDNLFDTAVGGTVDDARDGIERAIQKSFTLFLPLLTYQRTEFTYDEYQNTLSATVFYSLPNETTVQTSIGTLALNGNAPSKESYGN
jgi:hypothetical protein